MKATKVIGKYFWEHRDNSSWSINTRTTKKCFPINKILFLHKFCNISNMYSKKGIPSFIFCYRNSIVEILCISPIDGHRVPRSKIQTRPTIYLNFWEDFSLEGKRLWKGIFREITFSRVSSEERFVYLKLFYLNWPFSSYSISKKYKLFKHLPIFFISEFPEDSNFFCAFEFGNKKISSL